jgi:hypothetical protein
MSLPGLTADTQPMTNGDARAKDKRGADSLLDVARGKHAAATKDPGADRNAENLRRAKASGNWAGGFDQTTGATRTTS